MIKIAMVGQVPGLRETIADSHDEIEFVEENPDMVLVCGGDGTILISERQYPNIPKITVRNSEHGNKCMYQQHELDDVLTAIQDGRFDKRFDIIEETKLLAYNNGITFHALNEIQIHNASPMSAIRFVVEHEDEVMFADEVIADGVILCTPFGSTGYFKSVVKDLTNFPVFKVEIGIALNNAHNVSVRNDACLKSPKPITIRMTRGDAYLIADNNPFMKPLTTGDIVTVYKDANTAKFVNVR